MKNNVFMDRLSILSFLWAFQALIQKLRFIGIQLWYVEQDMLGWLQMITILCVLLKPRSLNFFIVFLIFTIIEISVRMPISSIHVTLEFLFSILNRHRIWFCT